jgi:hypothetical protein
MIGEAGNETSLDAVRDQETFCTWVGIPSNSVALLPLSEDAGVGGCGEGLRDEGLLLPEAYKEVSPDAAA